MAVGAESKGNVRLLAYDKPGGKQAMKRISIIFGTWPESIKLRPLILAIKENNHFEAHVCGTSWLG